MSVKIDYQYPPTVGEAVGDIQSIANGAALTIRPAVGVTWKITEIGHSGAVTIAFTDGTNTSSSFSETGAEPLEKCEYTVTHDLYITLTNSSGGALIYSYAGYIVNEV